MDSYRPAQGTPIEQLDTPCLLVDLDALDNNFKVVSDVYRDTICKMRPHTKNTKSPLLAHMQIRAGGTVGGVCTAKVSEAEVMIEGGVNDILVANQVTTKDKIARLCVLAARADMKVCIDNLQNVRDISRIATDHGVEVGVLIEVDTQMGRGGVRSVEDGVELAKLADSLQGINFKGVMSHQALGEYIDRETRFLESRRDIQICLDVKDGIEAAGIPVEVVSSGETHSYDVAAQMPGVTEVEGGTYGLMATDYDYLEEFQIANKVLGTVVSKPSPGIAIGDVGTRALATLEHQGPTVEGMPGCIVERILEDHIILKTNEESDLQVGDKFALLPGYQDIMVDRWDRYIAVRKGVVEQVMDIPGRGCTQ